MVSPVRIFLLEDDLDLRSSLESLLELEGYEVVAAADGAEAVDKAEDYSFDILVFDIKLPGPDGLEVLAQFKKENPELLSVVMTGYATEKDTLRALRLGVGDYLKKPFRSDVLLDAVRRLEGEVRRRRALEEREQSTGKLFLWLVEFMVGGLEANHEVKGLTMVESARAGRKIALGLGHSREAAAALQSAVLVSFLQEHAESDARLSELTQMLPESTLSLLSSMGSGDESPDTLASLANQVRALTEGPELLKELEEATGVSLQSDQPGRAQRKRRQLLSLARTFVASGDLTGARDACLKLTEQVRSAEAGHAYLELARMAWSEGDRSEANKNLRALLALIPSLGPQSGAELELEAGLSALGMGMADGRQLLERTLPRLERMGLSEGHALAVLSLRATEDDSAPLTDEQQRALRLLSQQRLTGALLSHTRWLLRHLLRLQVQLNDAELHRLLSQITQDATRSVGRTLGAELSEPELDLLLQLVEERGGSALLPSLQSVFARADSSAVRSRIEKIISGLTHQDTPTLRLNSLGPFEVWIGDYRLPETLWRTTRSRFLLAQLAARMGRPILAVLARGAARFRQEKPLSDRVRLEKSSGRGRLRNGRRPGGEKARSGQPEFGAADLARRGGLHGSLQQGAHFARIGSHQRSPSTSPPGLRPGARGVFGGLLDGVGPSPETRIGAAYPRVLRDAGPVLSKVGVAPGNSGSGQPGVRPRSLLSGYASFGDGSVYRFGAPGIGSSPV